MSGNISAFLNWNNFFWLHDVMSSIRSIKGLFNWFTSKFLWFLNRRFKWVIYSRLKWILESWVSKWTWWLICWLWLNSGVCSYFFDSSSVAWRFDFSDWAFHVISFNFIIFCCFGFNWNLSFYLLYFIGHIVNYSMSFYIVIFFNWSHFIINFLNKVSLSSINWN